MSGIQTWPLSCCLNRKLEIEFVAQRNHKYAVLGLVIVVNLGEAPVVAGVDGHAEIEFVAQTYGNGKVEGVSLLVVAVLLEVVARYLFLANLELVFIVDTEAELRTYLHVQSPPGIDLQQYRDVDVMRGVARLDSLVEDGDIVEGTALHRIEELGLDGKQVVDAVVGKDTYIYAGPVLGTVARY